MKDTCVDASSSSAKQKRSNPCRMNSSGGHPYVVISVDGLEVTPLTVP